MIYLDNSATTRVDERVLEAMLPYLKDEYGNPSSKYYDLATRARDAVEEARYHVARLINAQPEEIIFTSGATESNNMIIKGFADYFKYYKEVGNHIITSKVEHKAVINTCKFLNGDIYSNRDALFSLSKKKKVIDRGYNVTFLDVNQYGQVEEKTFRDAIKDETSMVSLIWANNELGTLNDIKKLASISHDKGVFFHTDATQIIGKMPVDVKDVNVDALSLSAHKLYGPKGVGAAYIKSDKYGLPEMSAHMHGGSQEEGIRGGTLAVHNIVGLGKAAELAYLELEERNEKLEKSHNMIVKRLKKYDFIEILGHPTERIPGLINITINTESFNNEQYIKSRASKLSISTGSACTAGEPSHVLFEISKARESRTNIRISVSVENTDNELKELTDLISEIE